MIQGRGPCRQHRLSWCPTPFPASCFQQGPYQPLPAPPGEVQGGPIRKAGGGGRRACIVGAGGKLLGEEKDRVIWAWLDFRGWVKCRWCRGSVPPAEGRGGSAGVGWEVGKVEREREKSSPAAPRDFPPLSWPLLSRVSKISYLPNSFCHYCWIEFWIYFVISLGDGSQVCPHSLRVLIWLCLLWPPHLCKSSIGASGWMPGCSAFFLLPPKSWDKNARKVFFSGNQSICACHSVSKCQSTTP